ncbi:MAG: citrate lyase holo-[acyl-carrier protein] synthase [bacterium]|nr:citrate lyase holo-[acyl-carrier protein] synthase [bacterium]
MKLSTSREGHYVDLEELLASRDLRNDCQQQLLHLYQNKPLISFMVNMPGPVKLCELTRELHVACLEELRRAFVGSILYQEVKLLNTGAEGYLVIDSVPEEVKRRACGLEDGHPLGRLWDIDVHTLDGQISRETLKLPVRRCLLCNNPAPVCARSRAHTVEELVEKIVAISESYFADRSQQERLIP